MAADGAGTATGDGACRSTNPATDIGATMGRHGIERTTGRRPDLGFGSTSAAAGSRDTRRRIQLLRPGTTARPLTQCRTACVSRTQDLVKLRALPLSV